MCYYVCGNKDLNQFNEIVEDPLFQLKMCQKIFLIILLGSNF